MDSTLSLPGILAKGVFDLVTGFISKTVGSDDARRNRVQRIVSMVSWCLLGISFLFFSGGEREAAKTNGEAGRALATRHGLGLAHIAIALLLIGSGIHSLVST